jgi:hypothetical protein
MLPLIAWPCGRLMVLAAITCAVSPSWCIAQSKDSAVVAAPAGTTTQTTYETGDICLPNSRVYVFVGKTGFGREHGVVGQIKQGRINMDAARDAGSLDIDMASFSADTSEARKFVGL